MANTNTALHAANRNKKDEFYTQLSDIEKELSHYREYFKDKIVLCNCDDPYESNFFKYFALNFNALGLKKLMVTCYDGSPISGSELPLFFELDENISPKKVAYKVEITEIPDLDGNGATDLSDVQLLLQSDKNIMQPLKGNGDFRSAECVELLKQADIVVTNPPFSLFREYVAQLVKYDKKFLIIGNQNSITTKDLFPLIKDNKIWLGVTMNGSNRWFRVPDDYEMTPSMKIEDGVKYCFVKSVVWYTNIEHNKRKEELILWRLYSPEEYPHYENYDAIEVGNVNNIPVDYNGVIGVPVTFLHKYNPSQFEILGMCENEDLYQLKTKVYSSAECKQAYLDRFGKRGVYDLNASGVIITNGKREKVYSRILIRKKQ